MYVHTRERDSRPGFDGVKIKLLLLLLLYVKSSMCSEKTKHLWYKYYRFFVRMYISSQQSYFSQMNTRQTSFEAYFDSHGKARDSSAP